MASNKFRQTLTISRAGKVSASLLFLLLLLFLSPSCNHHWLGDVATYATEDSSTAATNLNVNIQTAISVGLQQAVEMDITPKLDGTFAKSAAKMQVATNSANGYILTLSTSSDTNDLINSNASLQDSIKPTASNTTETNFTNNTWGYSLVKAGETPIIYNPVPTKDEAASLTVTGDQVNPTHTTYDLVFATKVDINLPAGSYSNSVIASAVANPITISTLNQLTYMQDMTPEICSNTRGTDGSPTVTPGHEVHRRLIDTRDGKAYWVAKLADGNCWMTQNLALDLKEGMTLTSGDTNLENGRVITVQDIPLTDYTNANQPNILPATLTSVPARVNDYTDYYYTKYSWNLGEYVLATPTKTVLSCSDLNETDPFSNCSDFQNVSGWQPTFQATTGTWKGELAGNGGNANIEGLVSAMITNQETGTGIYDAHYLIGNYYQFNTAVAGTDGEKYNMEDGKYVEKDVNQSICPRGWTLPKSGKIKSSGSGVMQDVFLTSPIEVQKDTFYSLLAQYGYSQEKVVYNQDPLQIGYNWNGGNPATPVIQGNSLNNYYENVAASPLYFTRSGYIFLPGERTLENRGLSSQYWSATLAASGNQGYNLEIYDIVMPSHRVGKYHAFSLRCIAQ